MQWLSNRSQSLGSFHLVYFFVLLGILLTLSERFFEPEVIIFNGHSTIKVSQRFQDDSRHIRTRDYCNWYCKYSRSTVVGINVVLAIKETL